MRLGLALFAASFLHRLRFTHVHGWHAMRAPLNRPLPAPHRINGACSPEQPLTARSIVTTGGPDPRPSPEQEPSKTLLQPCI